MTTMAWHRAPLEGETSRPARSEPPDRPRAESPEPPDPSEPPSSSIKASSR